MVDNVAERDATNVAHTNLYAWEPSLYLVSEILLLLLEILPNLINCIKLVIVEDNISPRRYYDALYLMKKGNVVAAHRVVTEYLMNIIESCIKLAVCFGRSCIMYRITAVTRPCLGTRPSLTLWP